MLAGEGELLVGQQEHEEFDAKSIGYQLTNSSDRFELAKDVAAFANGSNGGLIVCGLKTTRRRGSDVVRQIAPIDLAKFNGHNWIKTIRKLVVPAPEGVKVRARPISRVGKARGYVAVSVPPQPEHLKPFLVPLGRCRDGKIVENRHHRAITNWRAHRVL